MQFFFFAQDDRFSIRLRSPETCEQYPEGAFSPSVSFPVYALRVDGEGASAVSYFFVPAGDAAFYWLPMEQCRLARR